MAVIMEIKIVREEPERDDEFAFCASSDAGTGGETLYAGYGADPYLALHNLINNFTEAELFRPD